MRAVYEVVFSTSRLVALLENAGFSVIAPAKALGGPLRLVMDPGEGVLTLEVHTKADGWTPLRRETETVVPGRYL